MKELKGIPAAPGIAIGPLFKYAVENVVAREYPVTDTKAEWSRFEDALTVAEAQLQSVRAKALAETDAKAAAIFDAQAAMLRDPELLELCRAELERRRVSVDAVWQASAEHFAEVLEGLDDAYLRARAADIREVANRVLRVLAGKDDRPPEGPTLPSIIVAPDLTPADTILLDKSKVLGFCTASGGETSHTAILARALGLPAVVGVGDALMGLPETSTVVLNGQDGLVLVEPSAEEIRQWSEVKARRDQLHAGALSASREPAVTTDGKRVEIVANIGSVADARSAIERGAEGVGLLRTEFVYLERKALPDEPEQLRAYASILEVFGDLPVVLRTLDIGGDKAVPYLNLAPESNPFLGVRGLRLCLARPDLFKPQLRAALRAAVGHNLKIMFPMVSTLEEVVAARREIEACREELEREGKPTAGKIEIGIMVEVPSAAILADQIAPAVDFFSIGTNDLTQYTLAADRTNARLAHLASAFSPAVLNLIDAVIQAGHRHGKWVGVCGELAGQPQAIPILLGLGLDEFSMNAPSIPLAKQILRSLSVAECQPLAQRVLKMESAQQVRDSVKQSFPQTNI